MREIRLHGRGGQGTVLASELLATMYFESGKYAQAFPEFGVERRGAPVIAYTRIDETPIELHCGIYQPDHLLILDKSVIEISEVTKGLKKDGIVLVNSDQKKSEISMLNGFHTAVIDVNKIALKHNLGTPSLPIVNTAILGAYGALTGDFTIDLIKDIILRKAPFKNKENAAAAVESFLTMQDNGF